ncbi:hypothetical protein HaLaN_18918, partial [Haematococcus lacustris]
PARPSLIRRRVLQVAAASEKQGEAIPSQGPDVL